MPVQHRRVEVAAGHRILVRRAPGTPSRPGFIMVRTRTLSPFELAAERWHEGEIQQ